MSNQKKSLKRDIDGILLLNKPTDITSNSALQVCKAIFRAKKAGHTGTLDPFATGMLPVCLGQATKVAAHLTDAQKQYTVTCVLGEQTDTADYTGEVVARMEVPEFTDVDLERACKQLTGPIEQIPPMYSALRQQGKRLYDLARQGITVERKARAVTIFRLDLLNREPKSLSFQVVCSKGTYIRTLMEDLAGLLGTTGHVTDLHRDWVRPFEGARMISLETLRSASESELMESLMPPDRALSEIPVLPLSEAHAIDLSFGRRLDRPGDEPPGKYRVYDGDRFLGLVTFDGDAGVRPLRLFV